MEGVARGLPSGSRLSHHAIQSAPIRARGALTVPRVRGYPAAGRFDMIGLFIGYWFKSVR